MAQGTFVQALRKEAALSGTFMKGRSLMLNGAVLSIEDSGSRFSKNVTVEGSVRGSRGDLYKTHVALDVFGCQRRRARRRFAHAGSHVYGAVETARAHRTQSAGRQPQLSLSGARPHEPEPCGGALRSFGRAHG